MTVALLTAGCVGVQDATTDPTPSATRSSTDGLALTQTGEATKFRLYTVVSDEVPDGVVVISLSNESLDGDGMLKRIVRDSVRTDGISRTLHERVNERLRHQLEDLPRHDGSHPGYYFRYDGRIVNLFFAVLD